MREHKYRAWCAHDEMMYYDVQKGIIFDDGSRYGFHNFIETEDPQDYHEWELMQYTGLQDRNGREIFEGDIIKSIWHGVNGRDIGNTYVVRLGEHKYYDGECGYVGLGFYAEQISGEDYYEGNLGLLDIPHDIDCLCEVIGNIYENPELDGAPMGRDE